MEPTAAMSEYRAAPERQARPHAYICGMAPSRGPAADLRDLGFRAVFVPSPDRLPQSAPDLSDVESALTQLDALFRVAWAISDTDTLRLEAEFQSRFTGGTGGDVLLRQRFLPAPAPPMPLIRSLSVRSPLEIVAEIPPAFVLGGGAVAALGVLVERVLNLPLSIRARRERIRADIARYEAERTRSQAVVIAQQTAALRAIAPQNLYVRTVELFDVIDESGDVDKP
jgi:hypothetical protein